MRPYVEGRGVMGGVLDAEAAIEKAMEVARKAGVPTLFATVVGVRRVDGEWEVIIRHSERKYRALLKSGGEVVEWGEITA